jgi:hypothetical protein
MWLCFPLGPHHPRVLLPLPLGFPPSSLAALRREAEDVLISCLKCGQCRPMHPKYVDLCLSNLAEGVSVGQSLRLARSLLESLPDYASYNGLPDR